MKADEAYKKAMENMARNIERQQKLIDRKIEHAMSEGHLETTYDEKLFDEVLANLSGRLFKVSVQSGSSHSGYFYHNKISWKHFGK